MKRFTSMLLAVLALTIATVVAVQAQESTYPQQSTTQTATDPATSTPVDPAAAPATDLPATASPMPLVALGGLAAMAVGSALSRRRKA